MPGIEPTKNECNKWSNLLTSPPTLLLRVVYSSSATDSDHHSHGAIICGFLAIGRQVGSTDENLFWLRYERSKPNKILYIRMNSATQLLNRYIIIIFILCMSLSYSLPYHQHDDVTITSTWYYQYQIHTCSSTLTLAIGYYCLSCLAEDVESDFWVGGFNL